MKILTSFGTAFGVGFVAGVAPFIAIIIVPVLLTPGESSAVPTQWVPLIVVGGLVGSITAIMFHRTIHTEDLQKVFLYALGIPALLIGTISHLQSQAETRQTRIAASHQVLDEDSTIPLLPSDYELEEESPPADFGAILHLLSPRPAFAQAPSTSVKAGHFVSLGSYPNSKRAWKRVEELRGRRLRTEAYVEKDLRVFKTSSGSYYVSYRPVQTLANAKTLLKLLRINDPGLDPVLIHWAG